MRRYISMLRGINISGQKRMNMRDLAALYGSLGLDNAATYVQSGNVVFDSEITNVSALTRLIEEGIRTAFGYSVDVLLRTKEELGKIVAGNPLLKKRGIDTGKLHVTFLSRLPDPAAVKQLLAVGSETDSLAVRRKEIYLYCPGGYGRTKYSNNVIEKKLGLSATTRNWTTVTALSAMARGLSAKPGPKKKQVPVAAGRPLSAR